LGSMDCRRAEAEVEVDPYVDMASIGCQQRLVFVEEGLDTGCILRSKVLGIAGIETFTLRLEELEVFLCYLKS